MLCLCIHVMRRRRGQEAAPHIKGGRGSTEGGGEGGVKFCPFFTPALQQLDQIKYVKDIFHAFFWQQVR